MLDHFGYDTIFGRGAVCELLELGSASASKLLKRLLEANIIKPVAGHGKGKYRFSREKKL